MSFQRSSISEYNSNQMSQNAYSNVYQQQYNTQLSHMNEPDIQYTEKHYYIAISSRDRNTMDFPNVNSYSIVLPSELKNVTQIQLVQAILPDKNNIRNEPYMLLKIDEIDDVMISNDRYISDSFAIIQLSTPAIDGGFINMDCTIHDTTIKSYVTPKASLSKLSIRVTDCHGSLFNFGNNPGLQKEYQNIFVFKVTTLEKTRSTLQQRNVY